MPGTDKSHLKMVKKYWEGKLCYHAEELGELADEHAKPKTEIEVHNCLEHVLCDCHDADDQAAAILHASACLRAMEEIELHNMLLEDE